MRNKSVLTAMTMGVSMFLFGCNNGGQQAQTAQATKSTMTITNESPELEKVGYSLGYMMAEGNKGQVDDLNLDAFETGFRDGYEEKESALTQEQMQQVLVSYQEKKQAELIKEMEAKAASNKEEGQKFLAENKTKEGVQTTDSCLQYKVVKEGTGASPKATDMVKVHYEGKLIDGTVFDSSYERGEPIEFPLNQVIPGWTEGVQLMKKGAEYELYIPSDLAYGETGTPGIEPNSVLIFKVELLDFHPA